MRLVTPKVNVEIKYRKVSVNQLVPKPEIIMRSPDGKPVTAQRVTKNGEVLEGFNWRNYTEDHEEIPAKELQYFLRKEDGSEQPVRPFDRTAEIKLIKEVPATSMNGFLVESYYELFHKEESIINALYEEAERYIKDDLVGIALFSWGRGFKQYYAILYPLLQDGKFVWVMKLTQTRIVYQHLMEIPTMKVPIKQPPTLETLPPVEALIVQS